MPFFNIAIKLIIAFFLILNFSLLNMRLFYVLYIDNRDRRWDVSLLLLMLLFNVITAVTCCKTNDVSFSLQKADVLVRFILACFMLYVLARTTAMFSPRRLAQVMAFVCLITYGCLFCGEFYTGKELTRFINYFMILTSFPAAAIVARLVAEQENMPYRGLIRNYPDEAAMGLLVCTLAVIDWFGAYPVTDFICLNTAVFFISSNDDNKELVQLNMKKFNLTTRQTEIVLLLLKGYTYRRIGEVLFISEKTVNNHIQNIYEKTGATNKLDMARILNGG